MKNILIIISIVLTLKAHLLTGQSLPLEQLYIRNYGLKDGLRYSTNNCFLKDSKGFLWIGGSAIQRFDGYRFKTFYDNGNVSGFNSFVEDSSFSKQIWAGGSFGLHKFNAKKQSFDVFQTKINISGKLRDLVIAKMVCDANGDIWIAGDVFYAVLYKNAKEAVDASPLFQHLAEFSQRIYFDKKDNIWLCTNYGYAFMRYNIKTKQLFHFKNNPNNEYIFTIKDKMSHMLIDKAGNIWYNNSFGANGEVKKVDLERNTLNVYKIKSLDNINLIPQEMMMDSKGEVWLELAEHKGIAKFNTLKNKFDFIFSSTKYDGVLKDRVLPANPGGYLYIDDTDGFWYAGEGINYFSPYKQKFVHVSRLQFNKKNIIQDVELTACNGMVSLNDGNYYLTTYGNGLWRCNADFSPVEQFLVSEVPKDLFWGAFTVDGENLFFGAQDENLRVFNCRNKSIKKVKLNSYLNKLLICTTHVENKNRVWLGTWRTGIVEFNPQTLQIKSNNLTMLPSGEKATRIFSMLAEGEDSLWYVPFYRGLQLFSKKEGKTIWGIEKLKNDNEPLRLNSVVRYSRDTLILNTIDSGFIIYNTKMHSYTKVSMKDGLPANQISSVLVDYEKADLWVNSYIFGIFKYNIHTKQVTLFSRNEGNTATNSSLVAGWFKQPNKLIFGNDNGFTIYDYNKSTTNEKTNDVFFTDVYLNNKSINADSFFTDKNKKFDYYQNNITFHFSVLDFWKANSLRYYTKLNDGEWLEVVGKPEIQLAGIAPGKYTLSVKAIGEDGIETKINTISFKVKAPFFRSNTFYLLLALLVAAITYSLFRWRFKILQNQEKLKSDYNKQLAELEVSALRSQMNPHFVFNSLNAINRYILKSDKTEASNYLTKFSKLIRRILDNSRQQIIPLSQELEALELYLSLEALRFQQNFDWKIVEEDGISTTALYIPPMTIQPFVENAIWHGLLPKETNCKLVITIKPNDTYFSCIIEDNGIGRKKSAEIREKSLLNKTSVGIIATEKRLQLLAISNPEFKHLQIEDLQDENENALGTRVTINIPYNLN